MRFQKLAAATVSTVIACSISMPAFAVGLGAGMKASANTQTQIDGPCASAAVDKRDTAVIAAFDTFSAATKTSLTTRKDALKAAWLLTDVGQRKTALKAAWSAFAASQKSAREAFRKSKKAAWAQFRTDGKTCKANASDEGNVEATADVSL